MAREGLPGAVFFLRTAVSPLVESCTRVGYHTRLDFLPPGRSPALKFCALASGSKGNAVFVGSGRGGVLIDAGLSARELERRLVCRGLAPEEIGAVVVTHEHRDHIRGIGVWGRRHQIPVYMTEACRHSVERILGPGGLRGVEVKEFEAAREFLIDDLSLLAVGTSHDAVESVGFRISDGSTVLGFATDLGCVSPLVRSALRGAHLLYLESNHDEERLLGGPYPWVLKQRIRSHLGHLSNGACANLVAEMLHDGLRALVLGHLSEVNNEPHLAFARTRQVLDDRGAAEDVTLLVARQDQPGRVLELAA
jgi:phosphoribosyl 1,2-cyclic phosphodiesterase